MTACTCTRLRMAARAVTQTYDAMLQPSGLRATQFTLLAALATIGDAPLTQLADRLVMDRTTLTRNLKPLVGEGLVAIAADADRRIRRVHLTKAGRQAFETALPLWQRAQAGLVERFGQTRWAGLLDDLDAAVAAVQ